MNRRHVANSLPLALLAALAFAGCNGNSPPVTPAGDHDHGEKGDAHPHLAEGPHHGILIDLGEGDYHAELAHDDTTKTLTIYLLDKEGKSAVPIPDPEIVLNLVVDGKPLQAKLAASPQGGDPTGQSSRFAITDEVVIEAHDAPKTTGRINVTINGKAYSGTVEHHEHGEHKH